MKHRRYKMRLPAVLLTAVAAIGLGGVAVKAAPQCQRIVQRYVEKVQHHPVSKATLARWAEWRNLHPNYHPPKRQQQLTPQETYDKVNFACEVPLDPDRITDNLPPELTVSPVFPVQLATITPIQPVAPLVSLVSAPLAVPPTFTGGDVPEPASWMYMATGLAMMLLVFRKFRPAAQA
jgi:hypothetical protein